MKINFLIILLLFSSINLMATNNGEKSNDGDRIKSILTPDKIDNDKNDDFLFIRNIVLKNIFPPTSIFVSHNYVPRKSYLETDLNPVFTLSEICKKLIISTSFRLRFRIVNSSIERASYMPRINFTWISGYKKNRYIYFFNLLLSHHSNGSENDGIYNRDPECIKKYQKEGEYIGKCDVLPDKDGNIINRAGNFSTNFIDFNFNLSFINWKNMKPKNFKIGFIHHFSLNREVELDNSNLYEKDKIYLKISSFNLSDKKNFNYSLKLAYRFGQENNIKKNTINKIWKLDEYLMSVEKVRNISFEIITFFKIPKIDGINFFIKYEYDHMDYMNMEFNKEINRFSIGISSDFFTIYGGSNE